MVVALDLSVPQNLQEQLHGLLHALSGSSGNFRRNAAVRAERQGATTSSSQPATAAPALTSFWNMSPSVSLNVAPASIPTLPALSPVWKVAAMTPTNQRAATRGHAARARIDSLDAAMAERGPD